MIGKKAGQAAMEYLMTYGWALLVIVIVIAILLIMNPFSAPQTCKFDQIGFACNNMAVTTSGALLGSITNGNNNGIKVIKVTCEKPSTAPTNMTNSGGTVVARQASFDVPSGVTCTGASGAKGVDYSGKIWVYYANDEDNQATYPVRVASANIVTKLI